VRDGLEYKIYQCKKDMGKVKIEKRKKKKIREMEKEK